MSMETTVDQAALEGPPARKGVPIWIVIAGALVMLVGAAGAYGYASGMFLSGARTVETPQGDQMTYYDLPEITVNLATTNATVRYLKLRVTLQVANRGIVQMVEPHLPRIIDTFQVYLREMRTEDLSGSAGLYRLREELTRRINIAIAPEEIDDVLFQELIIQ